MFAIEADDHEQMLGRMRELSALASESPSSDIDHVARQWWRRYPETTRALSGKGIVADSIPSLLEQIERAERDGETSKARASFSYSPGSLAFVYPGLGNQFAGMGRALTTLWPEVVATHDATYAYLRDQFDPDLWWRDQLPAAFSDHCDPILGSVAMGAFMTDVLGSLGVVPSAAIGYSLGESAALVALKAWPDRDGMLQRLRSSPLFSQQLAGPCEAARRAWKLAPDEEVDWVAGIIPRSSEAIRAALGGETRAYVLIRNSARETVVGGHRRAVERLVETVEAPFIPLSTVSTVHCAIGKEVENEYRELHSLETNAPPVIVFYSGAIGRPYSVDRDSAASAITGLAVDTIDFPAVINRAYEDGIRVFVEPGPGGSCSRMIDHILRGRPHLAVPVSRADRDPFKTLLEVLAALIAHRVPCNLARLYGDKAHTRENTDGVDRHPHHEKQRKVRVDVRASSIKLTPPPAPRLPRRTLSLAPVAQQPRRRRRRSKRPPRRSPDRALEKRKQLAWPLFRNIQGLSRRGPRWRQPAQLPQGIYTAVGAAGAAHQAFLRL